MASKNTTYISPEYINKYINIMDEFVKKPLHATMKGNEFMFCSDETPDVTSLEQLTLYLTFIMNGENKEHFIDLSVKWWEITCLLYFYKFF